MSRSVSRRLVPPLLALAVSVGALGFALPAATTEAFAAGTGVPERSRGPQSLLAESDAELVVALFSLPGCPYCEVVRRNYLRPLEGQVRALRVVEYGIDDTRGFTDVSTETTLPDSAAALAKSLGIRVAPTVVFLGKDGHELAERLVGYNSPDFYGAYLDRRIASALARARE
ncbi:MAG TPA: thioredoxin fold domain-containing protein [Zeimonas sp.]